MSYDSNYSYVIAGYSIIFEYGYWFCHKLKIYKVWKRGSFTPPPFNI